MGNYLGSGRIPARGRRVINVNGGEYDQSALYACMKMS
jgi:hypothetical protein